MVPGRQGLAFREAQVEEACVERVQALVRQRVIGLFSGADCFACARACEAWAAGCPCTEIISCGYVLRAASPAGRLASRVAARARLRENWALSKAVW